MNEKRSFSVAAIGIPENERQALKNIFRLSSYRTRSYLLTDSLLDAEILIVNESAKDTVVEALGNQNSKKHSRSTPMIIVTAEQSNTHPYCVRRPFVATRVLGALDQIAIKELSFVPELVIGDDNSLATPAAEILQTNSKPQSKKEEKSYRALVVDDSLAVRKLMELELKMLNIHGDFAANASQAFEYLEHYTYDIIFLDVVLPDVDGYKICKNIKKNKYLNNIPVLMLTGKSSAFDRVRGKFAGCDSYLTKPAQSYTFRKAIKQYLPIDMNADSASTVDDVPNKAELMRLAELS